MSEEVDDPILLNWGWGFVIPHTTSCKHGDGDCDECGTSDRRDVKHTTRGGKGVVGRLK